MSGEQAGKTKAKPTNKLIESIAEQIGDAMCEMLAHAIEYGDESFVDSVIETLRNFDYTVVDNANADEHHCPVCGRVRGGP